MSTYMQRQAELWQRRAWKAEDNLRCLLQELEDSTKHAEDNGLPWDVELPSVSTRRLWEIIEHYKGEIK